MKDFTRISISNSPFYSIQELTKMNQSSGGVHICFHLIYGPNTTIEHQGSHMDHNDCLAVTFALIGKVVHKGHQANVLSMGETMNGFYHEGKKSQRTLQEKG